MKPGFYCTACGELVEEQHIDDKPIYENCRCGQFILGEHPDDIGYEEDDWDYEEESK